MRYATYLGASVSYQKRLRPRHGRFQPGDSGGRQRLHVRDAMRGTRSLWPARLHGFGRGNHRRPVTSTANKGWQLSCRPGWQRVVPYRLRVWIREVRRPGRSKKLCSVSIKRCHSTRNCLHSALSHLLKKAGKTPVRLLWRQVQRKKNLKLNRSRQKMRCQPTQIRRIPQQRTAATNLKKIANLRCDSQPRTRS